MEEKLSNKSDECSFIHETVFFLAMWESTLEYICFRIHWHYVISTYMVGRWKKTWINGNCIYHIDLFYRFVLSRYADGL